MMRLRLGDKPNTVIAEFELTIETDDQKIAERNLGLSAQTCKLCGATGEFQTWLGVENYIGLKDEFRYFVCPRCLVLQIESIPEDMSRYYPPGYYSYEQPHIKPAAPGQFRDERRILDVGCGSGIWLCSLAECGYVNLHGCDPFIDQDRTYANGVNIKKCSIHEMEGQFDVINLAHSFEHMPDPKEVFKSFTRLLSHGLACNGDRPKIELAIPVFPNAAFDIFGPFWFQMDPPRHFFLHSEQSIFTLAAENGFAVTHISYSGVNSQFIRSRAYQLGLTYSDSANNAVLRTPEYSGVVRQVPTYNILVEAANMFSCADMAAFTLVWK